MRSYLKTLACVLIATAPVILMQATAHPIRSAVPVEPLPPPIHQPNFDSPHGPAEIRLDGDLLTIELPTYFASGRADDDGFYRVVWLTLPAAEVRYFGVYRFDCDGDLVGGYVLVDNERGSMTGSGGEDRYRRKCRAPLVPD